MIIRVVAPLLRGLPAGEYDVDDPRLKGRGHHWVQAGMVDVVGGDTPTEEPEPESAPKRRKKAVTDESV